MTARFSPAQFVIDSDTAFGLSGPSARGVLERQGVDVGGFPFSAVKHYARVDRLLSWARDRGLELPLPRLGVGRDAPARRRTLTDDD